MNRALGFLTGVGLTLAVFAVSVDRLTDQPSNAQAPIPVLNDIQPGPIESTAMTTQGDAPIVSAFGDDERAGTMDGERLSERPVPLAAADPSAALPSALSALQESRPTDGDESVPEQVIEAVVPLTSDIEGIGIEYESVQEPGLSSFNLDSGSSGTHTFWSPFRSEWAASGFARRLTDATQITIDVVEEGRGRYRAAFQYRDEGQRLEILDRIESITGLEVN